MVRVESQILERQETLEEIMRIKMAVLNWVGLLALVLPVAVHAQDTDQISWSDFLNTRISCDDLPEDLSVGRFVTSIQERNPRLNVIVDRQAASFPLPVLRFTDVPLRGALSMISHISNNEIDVQIDSIDEGAEADMVYIRRSNVSEHIIETRVISVAALIKVLDKEAFLAAFEEGFRFLDVSDKVPEMRFHEQTGLLFVKGSPQQVEFAQQIVIELQRGATSSHESSSKEPPSGLGSDHVDSEAIGPAKDLLGR